MRVWYVIIRLRLLPASRSKIGRPRKRPHSPCPAPKSQVPSPHKHYHGQMNTPNLRKTTDSPRLSPRSSQDTPPLRPSEEIMPDFTMPGMEAPSVPETSSLPTTDGVLSSTLSDLSLAAFVESLYTLEISPSDGLTPNMLNTSGGEGFSTTPYNACYSAQLEQNACATNISATSLHGTSLNQFEYAKSTFLDEQLSFSVPSDMRWWNTAWALPLSPDDPLLSNENEISSNQMRPSTSFVEQSIPSPGLPKPILTDQMVDVQNTPPVTDSALMVPDSQTSINIPPENETLVSHSDTITSPSAQPSCCNRDALHHNFSLPLPDKSSNSGRKNSGSSDTLAPLFPIGSKCCSHGDQSEAEPSSSKALSSLSSSSRSDVKHNPDRVHCVPSPDGKQCSCRCGSGLAFLSLERSIRNHLPEQKMSEGDTPTDKALTSLVFTLTMSQSVSKQCSCSADCPTCKRSTSYKSSAAILLSTALQIYARALQLFRDMLASDGSNRCSCSSLNTYKATCACSLQSSHATTSQNGMDVRIGDYIPSTQNSRKIALYALKLELIDLERALARVNNVAKRPLQPGALVSHATDTSAAAPSHAPVCRSSCCINKSHDAADSQPILRLNPFDQLVIRKLHMQLNEVLHVVEHMEVHNGV